MLLPPLLPFLLLFGREPLALAPEAPRTASLVPVLVAAPNVDPLKLPSDLHHGSVSEVGPPSHRERRVLAERDAAFRFGRQIFRVPDVRGRIEGQVVNTLMHEDL